MSAAKVRLRYVDTGAVSERNRARGWREYALERHVGRVSETVGLVVRDSNGEWRGLHLGPFRREWTPGQRTRAAVAETLLDRAQVKA